MNIDKFTAIKLAKIELIIRGAINAVVQIKKCRLETEEADYTLANLFDGLRILDEMRAEHTYDGKKRRGVR